MKIIGGKYKNRNFYMPSGIKPTQNIVRKALFDILGQDLEGFEFLELFSGSGAVGIEALSRGAKKVVFVEKEPKCMEVINENLSFLGMKEDKTGLKPYETLNTDGFIAIKMFFDQKRKFDIIFIDPPYGRSLAKKALKTIDSYDILHPNSIMVLQHEKKEILPQKQGRFLLFRQKKYGNSVLSFYK